MGDIALTPFYRVPTYSLLFFAFFLLAPGAFAADKFLALGTSSANGVYYPVGKGICDLINAGRDRHLLRCIALTTGGSIYNIQALTTGELDLAITRADLAYNSFKGKGIFSRIGANVKLRAITTLYDNPLGVVVKADSKIKSFADFSGKRINIGNKGSGKRAFADVLFKVMNWKRRNFAKVTELSSGKMAKAFCNGKLDILIQVMGLPADFYDKVIRKCGGRFVPVPVSVVAAVKKMGPFFEDAVIPGGMYPANPKDVRTIGTKAVLVTSSRLDQNAIYQVAKAIFGDLGKFRAIHPALGAANAQTMLEQGLFIPIHKGALAYYKSAGLKVKIAQ